MKRFRYDSILAADDICNLTTERDALLKHIKHKEKVVVYGPRNYGKTSLIKSVIIPEFRKSNKKSFVFFVDLMEVRSNKAIDLRMSKALESSLAESFPKKNLIESVIDTISALRPTIEFDPITSQPGITLNLDKDKNYDWWPEILKNIRDNFAKKYPCLLVFDEFQDLAAIDGVQGVIRNVLQEFSDIPMIIMGSKRHLLTKMFAIPDAPLFNFGIDLEFEPINYKEYWLYMQERFEQRDISISLEKSILLQNMLSRVPEPINMLCSELLNSLEKTEIDELDINNALKATLEGRKGRFQTLLSSLSESEEEVLVALQKYGPVQSLNGKDFLKKVNVSASGVRKVVAKLEDSGVLETNGSTYSLVDPLLAKFVDIYY